VPDLPTWLQGLNPQQLQAVTHGDGPLPAPRFRS